MRNNEQGRSMIEMLGVLAIVGVLSVGGIAGYSKAMAKFKTNKAIDHVNMIATNIRTLYSSQRNYDGLQNGLAIRMGAIPADMYDATRSDNTVGNSDANITNAFGGKTLVRPGLSTASASEKVAFVIAMDSIPATACVSLLTTDWGGDAGTGLAGIYAKGGSDAGTADNAVSAIQASDFSVAAAAGVYQGIPGDENYSTPATLMQASQACSGAKNTIAWKFL